MDNTKTTHSNLTLLKTRLIDRGLMGHVNNATYLDSLETNLNGRPVSSLPINETLRHMAHRAFCRWYKGAHRPTLWGKPTTTLLLVISTALIVMDLAYVCGGYVGLRSNYNIIVTFIVLGALAVWILFLTYEDFVVRWSARASLVCIIVCLTGLIVNLDFANSPEGNKTFLGVPCNENMQSRILWHWLLLTYFGVQTLLCILGGFYTHVVGRWAGQSGQSHNLRGWVVSKCRRTEVCVPLFGKSENAASAPPFTMREGLIIECEQHNDCCCMWCKKCSWCRAPVDDEGERSAGVVRYIGQVNRQGIPHGFGYWTDNRYYGETLVGYWANGKPSGPYKSTETGTGSGFMCIRIGWGKYAKRMTYGVAEVECSVSGVFFREFPTANLIHPPSRIVAKSFLVSARQRLARVVPAGIVRDIMTPTNAQNKTPGRATVVASPRNIQSMWPTHGGRDNDSLGDSSVKDQDSSTMKDLKQPSTDVLKVGPLDRECLISGVPCQSEEADNREDLNEPYISYETIHDSDSVGASLIEEIAKDVAGWSSAVPRLKNMKLDDLQPRPRDSKVMHEDGKHLAAPEERPFGVYNSLRGSPSRLTILKNSKSDDLSPSQWGPSLRVPHKTHLNKSQSALELDAKGTKMRKFWRNLTLKPKAKTKAVEAIKGVTDIQWCLEELSPHAPNFGLQPRTEVTVSVDPVTGGVAIAGYIEAKEVDVDCDTESRGVGQTDHVVLRVGQKSNRAWPVEPDDEALTELDPIGWYPREVLELPEVLLYIHGYNNSHTEALQILGQMASFGNYPNHMKLFVFAWPAGSSVLQFNVAKRNAESQELHEALFRYIVGLRENGVRQLHVMCHSMGSRLFIKAFRRCLSNLFRPAKSSSSAHANLLELVSVTLLNPEYYLEQFVNEDYYLLRSHSDQITIFADANDKALSWSEFFTRKQSLGRQVFGCRSRAHAVSSQLRVSPKYMNTASFFHVGAGSDMSVHEEWLDVDVIDTTFIDQNVHSMRHSFWSLNREVIEDLREMMLSRRRARQRSGRLDRRRGNVWVYRVAPAFLTSIFDSSV